MTALELKENRKRLKLTQEELAKEVGVDRRTIINYEQGEVIPESKVKLLHILFFGNKEDESETLLIDTMAKELLKSKVFVEGIKELFKSELPEKENDPENRAELENLLAEIKKERLLK